MILIDHPIEYKNCKCKWCYMVSNDINELHLLQKIN